MSKLVNSVFESYSMQRTSAWLARACLALVIILPLLVLAYWLVADSSMLAVRQFVAKRHSKAFARLAAGGGRFADLDSGCAHGAWFVGSSHVFCAICGRACFHGTGGTAFAQFCGVDQRIKFGIYFDQPFAISSFDFEQRTQYASSGNRYWNRSYFVVAVCHDGVGHGIGDCARPSLGRREFVFCLIASELICPSSFNWTSCLRGASSNQKTWPNRLA